MFAKVNGKVVRIEDNDEEMLEFKKYLNSVEYKKARIEELKKCLADTDYIICKIVEGKATLEDYEDTTNRRDQWRKEINELEIDIGDDL